MRVGLIGAGMMGRGMGHRLLVAKHALNVMAHQRREVIDELVALGATEHGSAVAVATASDVVVTCLPGVDSLEAVLFGEQGVAASPRPVLVVDCTTSLPDASRQFAARLAERGHRFVDAPVTGGPGEALAGKLMALVGGEPADTRLAGEVLGSFCDTVQVFGGVGAGNAVKLINNGIGFGILGVVSEALATAAKQGIEMASLLPVVARGGGQNRLLQGLSPWLLQGDASMIQVSVATACKDVAYYMRLARDSGSAGPVMDAVLAELRRAIDAGLGPDMLHAYPASIAAQAGVTLPPAG